MKNVLLLVSLSLMVLGLNAQELTTVSSKKSKTVKQKVTQNSTKTYGDVIWEEDFNKDKWFSTVKEDDQGYLLDTTATMPVGWTFIDNTNNSYYWHWSDVGPRGAYTSGYDDDPFTPNNDLLDMLPDETTIDNGFMLLESDYFNTTPEGEMVDNPIDMNTYFEFGPINFSSYEVVMFNCKILNYLCCETNILVGLYISSDYNPTSNTGNWELFKLNTQYGGDFTIDRDMHIDVSNVTAGHNNVYFRIGKKQASHYFVIIDDIKFYEPPVHNLEVEYGWADYIYDAEDADYKVDETLAYNFWGGYTEIPYPAVSNFVKFRAAVYNFATNDAENSKLNVKIFKDEVLDYSISSEPKLISTMEKDTLRVFTDYAPTEVGNYQVSMTITQGDDDELFGNNGWGYNFKVTDGNRFSRVRHGMEEEFIWAGPREWVLGGNDGDRCVQRFTISDVTGSVHVKGISVYIDDYTNRPDEIAAIENGDFSMIAHLYKVNENDSIIDTGISSDEYTLVVSDTATWVTLDFKDEVNLVIGSGLYYAGIEIFTGNIDLRFQIGEDTGATTQPNGGGLVYFNPTNPIWVKSGDNYAIDLIIDTYNSIYITFNVDMTNVETFNPDNDTVYVTGNFADWDVPGTGQSRILTDVNNDLVYSGIIPMISYYGEMQYKYYINSGLLGSEWEGEPNRTLNIIDTNIVINPPDIFGLLQSINGKNLLNNILVYPNPFSGNIVVSNLSNAKQIMVSYILGQTILSIPVTGNKIDVDTQNLKKGVYLITIIDNNNNTITKKVVKN